MVSNVHDIATKAQEENRQRCIFDCMKELPKAGPQSDRKINFTRIVNHFRESNLNLLISDKEGGFVVTTREIYLDKAQLAIDKNLNCLERFNPKTVKAKALQMCHKLDLTQLRKQISTVKSDQLEMFFTAKVRKEGCPFRVVVTERGSW